MCATSNIDDLYQSIIFNVRPDQVVARIRSLQFLGKQKLIKLGGAYVQSSGSCILS